MAEEKFFFLNLIPAGVTGQSIKIGHAGWVEVDSWSFSMTQPAQPNVGGGQPKGTMATGSFSFTMKHAGPQIFKNVAQGAHIPGPAQFDAERAGVNQSSATGVKQTGTYLTLKFYDFAIVSRNLGGDSGQKVENISIAFSKVSLGYAQVANGQLKGMTTKTYDQKSNQVT